MENNDNLDPLSTLCPFCNNILDTETVKLTEKGANSINKISNEFNINVRVAVGQEVHTQCRKLHSRLPTNNQKGTPDGSRSSSSNRQPTFRFKDHCMFCETPVKADGKKRGISVYPVRTKDFQSSITKICKERRDSWGLAVLGRIEFVQDLHAADAVYHQECSANFRTGKQIPHEYFPRGSEAKKQKGHPKDDQRREAFQKVSFNITITKMYFRA